EGPQVTLPASWQRRQAWIPPLSKQMFGSLSNNSEHRDSSKIECGYGGTRVTFRESYLPRDLAASRLRCACKACKYRHCASKGRYPQTGSARERLASGDTNSCRG